MKTAVLLLAAAALCSATVVNMVPGEGAKWAERLRASNAQPVSSPSKAFKFIPAYVAAAHAGEEPASWGSDCFEFVNASVTWTSDRTADVVAQVGARKKGASLLCQEGYLVAFVGAFEIKFFTKAHSTQTIHLKANYSDAQLFDLRTQGVRFFRFADGLVATAEEMLATAVMFVGYLTGKTMPSWSVEANLKFMEASMNYKMAARNVTRVDLPESELHSGDLLCIMRLDGLDPMIAWGMGSRTAHMALVLEYEPGVMYVCEANSQSGYWPIEGVQCSKWADWIDMAEKASYVVSILPVRPEVSKQFDIQAVRNKLAGWMGIPYGIHTFFSGWIDTAEDNYPGGLSSPLTMIMMQVIEWITDDLLKLGPKGNLFAEDMSKRLGKTGLNVAQVYQEAAAQGLSFTELVTIPSRDDWIFDFDGGIKGPSMVCCVFATAVYKAAGVMGDYNTQIQASEFTNWDVYTLDLFDREYRRPQACVDADPELPYCQLLGSHRMTLEDTWGTVKPFAHMREKCPSKAPDYIRPDDC